MESICTEDGCSDPVSSRGLCSAHYQKARYHKQLPETPERACKGCGNPFTPAHWDTLYCSPECKVKARSAALRAATRARHAERRCEFCGEPIPLTAGGNARTCSRKCSVALQKAKQTEARREAWRASDPRCEQCQQPIPDSRRVGVKYCSLDCKKKVQDARWRERAPHYMRQYLYGITQAEYEAMLAAQGGVCGICGTDNWAGKHNRPNVDHCHKTGRFRGLLCEPCNQGIGKFADDPARLRAAAGYLEKIAAGHAARAPA